MVGWVVLASLVLPVVASVAFMPSYGAIWQGRYELLFVIGILPLCGLVLDDAFAPGERDRLTATALVCLAVVQVVSVVVVMHRELGRTVSTEHSGWVHPPLVAVAALALAGFAVLSRVAWEARDA